MYKFESQEDLTPGAPLETVLSTEELSQRPTRAPDYESENRVLAALARSLNDSPGTILQTLVDTILEVFSCGTVGISLLSDDASRFYWPAVAGIWKAQIGGGTPRQFGPCGDVLDRNDPLLFKHLERRYTYFQGVKPLIAEALLVPFYADGKAVGTIWAIFHDPEMRQFDREHLRMLTSLGGFASSAFSVLLSLGKLEMQGKSLRELNGALLISAVRQHQLTEQAQHATRRLTQLQRVTMALSETMNLLQVAKVIVEQGVPALGAATGSVLLLSEDGQTLELLHSSAPEVHIRLYNRFALSLGLPATDALLGGQAVWIESAQQYQKRYPQLAEQIIARGLQAAVALPMSDKGRRLGVLALSFDQVQVFSPEDRDYALTLASLCAQALERARLRNMEQQAREGLETRVQERTAQLEQSSAELRALSARLEATREDERARLSRDLHDELGGALTGLKMDIAKIGRRRNAGQTPEDLEPLLAAVDDMVHLIRRLATELRPGLLDDFGLAAALEWQLQEFQKRSETRCHFYSDLTEISLPEGTAIALFRIFQEALTNVARHAQATEVDVWLQQAGGNLELMVHDNGRGIILGNLTNQNSLGLAGMRERVRLLAGEINFDGLEGQGTTVLVKIPLLAV